MSDHQTRSVWSPYLATAIRGKLSGAQLHLLPVQQMQWGLWRDLHPTTKVLAANLGERTGHGSDHSIGSPGIHYRMRKGVLRWDTRLTHNTLVLGVVHSSGRKVYPLDMLRKKTVVSDELGGSPIVIFMNPSDRSYAALAFSRSVEGRQLSFRPSENCVVDAETGSTWSYTGKALHGPLEGVQLTFLPSHVSEWYVWAANYPDIEIAEDKP